MDDALFAAELAAVLGDTETYPLGFATVAAAQAGVNVERPSLTISGSYEAFGSVIRKGTVDLELRSRFDEQAEHRTRFSALWAALMADGAAASLITRISGREAVELLSYGRNKVEADVDGEDLRTLLTLNVAWRFV